MIQLAISNIAWTADSDDEMYDFLHETGIGGLEIAPGRLIPENPYDNLSQATKISRDLQNRYNLTICSMQSILYGAKENLFRSVTERNILTEKVQKAIDFAAAIQCKNLVYGAPSTRQMESDEQYAIAEDFFQALAAYAYEKQTVLSIEAISSLYNTNFINTTPEAIAFAKKINNPAFRINADTGTLIENKEDIQPLLDHIELINHIHISEPGLAPIKQRDLHRLLAQELHKAAYKGFVSIEMRAGLPTHDIKSIIGYIRNIFL